MERKNRNRGGFVIAVIISVILCSLVIGAGINSWLTCPASFWSISIANCVALLVAIILSFIYVQKQAIIERNRAEQRKQREAAIRLLGKLESIVTSPSAYIVTDEKGIEALTMTKRRISNCIQTLKQYADAFSIKESVDFIDTKFREYADIIGNHIDDLGYLKKSQLELLRPLELIEGKIDDLVFELNNISNG